MVFNKDGMIYCGFNYEIMLFTHLTVELAKG